MSKEKEQPTGEHGKRKLDHCFPTFGRKRESR